MAIAYLASTDFPRNRFTVENSITISLPASSDTALNSAELALTDSFNNSVIRIVEAMNPSSTVASLSTLTSDSTTPSSSAMSSATDNEVLRLISNSMDTIEQAASSLVTRPPTTRPSTSTLTTPSASEDLPRGLNRATPSPAALRVSPVFASSPESVVIDDPLNVGGIAIPSSDLAFILEQDPLIIWE